MTKTEAFLKSGRLYPGLTLESYFSAPKRRWLIEVSKYILLSIPVIIILDIIGNGFGIDGPGQTTDFLIEKLLGLVFIALGLYILMNMFEAYFCSIFYFEYVARNKYPPDEIYTFSAGRILRRAKNDNILTGFLRSQGVGQKIMSRLGISPKEANELLEKQAEVKNPPVFKTEGIPLVKVSHLVDFIYANHADFRTLLANHGLNQKDLQETAAWVIYNIEDREYDRQWWAKEKLAKIPGFASDWSFGRTYLLNKYSRDLFADEEVNQESISFSGRTRELEQTQDVLARSAGANALLVGLPGQEKMEVVWNLCRKIKDKTARPELIGKRPR